MKTKRKIVKTPAKGKRRTSVGLVKKSPISRRNLRSATKKVKPPTVPKYQSPLEHLLNNGPEESQPLLKSSIKSKSEIHKEITQEDKKKVENINYLDLPSTSKTSQFFKKEKIEENTKVNKMGNKISSQENNDVLPKRNKRRYPGSETATKFPKAKTKQKMKNKKSPLQKLNSKKSPLSKIKEMDDSDKLSDSVIFEDDVTESKKIKSEVKTESVNVKSETKTSCINDTSLRKPVINTSNVKRDENFQCTVPELETISLDTSLEMNCVADKSLKNSTFIKPSTNNYNDEVIVIDCDDTFKGSNESFMEMEAYHHVFSENMNSLPSSPVKTNFTDSIIIIDPDDEVSVDKPNTSKSNEDCLEVWSSLPQPCTSTSSMITSNEDVIRFEPTHASSFRNNPDIQKYKILVDTTAELSNLRFLNNENNAPKRKTNKAVRSVSKSTASKGIKSTTTTGKKKVKNNGELIFLSESKDESSMQQTKSKKGKLREIIIDGNNVAMAYTNNKSFSEKGIKMLIDYFIKKGHVVKVFVPQYRRSRNYPLLEKWNGEGIVVFTPSRRLGNKNFTPYDDRYILEYATACNGIVVSQDQFRDLYAEKPEYRDTIENRLLPPTFVGDYVMFPEDPLGRNGPTLTNFLKH